jgi:uncharacterized membrane protein
MSDYAPAPASPPPIRRPVSYADVFDALRAGWKDFTRAPLPALFFGGVYALGGILIFWLLSVYQQPWMIIPIAIGFPLVGPFLAAGTYELSRRLGAGETLSLRSILSFMARQSRREFAWMAFVVLFIFWIWMYQARVLIALFLDMQAFSSVGALGSALFTSADGLMMLTIGTFIGGIIATLLFTTTVISMPLLVERELDVVTALITSWKVVLENPGPLLLWGAVVGSLTFLAMIPFFLGLFVVFPVLGFATWHLYKGAIAKI